MSFRSDFENDFYSDDERRSSFREKLRNLSSTASRRKKQRRSSPNSDPKRKRYYSSASSNENSPRPIRHQMQNIRVIDDPDDIDHLVFALNRSKLKDRNGKARGIDDIPQVFKGPVGEGETKALLPEKPFKPYPMKRECPKCGTTNVTKIKSEASMATYFLCFIICLTGGSILCCCFLPFCMDKCQRIEHRCSKCKTYLGEYLPR